MLANTGHRSGDVARQGHLAATVPGAGVESRGIIVLEYAECVGVQRLGHVRGVRRQMEEMDAVLPGDLEHHENPLVGVAVKDEVIMDEVAVEGADEIKTPGPFVKDELITLYRDSQD